jgi:hypothetical protein
MRRSLRFLSNLEHFLIKLTGLILLLFALYKVVVADFPHVAPSRQESANP